MDWGSRKISLGEGVGMRLENWLQQTGGPQCAWPIRSPISGGSSSKRSQGPSCQGGFFFPKPTLWAVQGPSKPLQAGIPGHLLSRSRCLLFPIIGVLEVIHMYFREKPQWAATKFKASLSIKPGSLLLLPYYLLSNYQATHQNFCREMRLLFSKRTTNVVSKMTAKSVYEITRLPKGCLNYKRKDTSLKHQNRDMVNYAMHQVFQISWICWMGIQRKIIQSKHDQMSQPNLWLHSLIA